MSNRYDMAQAIYNLAHSLNENGTEFIKISNVDTSSVSTKIGDYQKVPNNYRAAVEYCYAAGFITGTDQMGTFGGTDTMNRDAAATVLCRMLNAKNGNWTAPDRGTAPAPTVTAVKDMITVTANPKSQPSYDYEISVSNTLTDGKLSNGKSITEANIKAMLSEIKTIFPADTSWALTTDSGDSYYFSMTHGAPTAGGACNSFAGMTFSTVFGVGAKYTKDTDIYNAKPGDLIELKDYNNIARHWFVVVSNDGTRLTTCEGNVNGVVSWGTLPIAYTLNLYPNSVLYTAY